MTDFEIDLPTKNDLIIDVTDKSLYDYNFNSFSLLPLQQSANFSVTNKLKEELLSHISEASLINKAINFGETEYVANLSEFAKEKIAAGDWSLGIRKKTGETYGVIKDTISGKNKSFITLNKRVVSDLGTLPQLAAIQSQLKSITEEIENLNHSVKRVEQGQYNDRYAGFFSARQLVIEAIVAQDLGLKKDLLTSAIRINNETVAKLMVAIHHDSMAFIDTTTKKKDAQRLDNLLQNSLGYLNSSIQLNLVAYTALGERKPLLASLANYQSFVDQTLLKTVEKSSKSVAWLMDNSHQGNDGRFLEFSNSVSSKITQLLDFDYLKEIGGKTNEKIEDMYDAEVR